MWSWRPNLRSFVDLGFRSEVLCGPSNRPRSSRFPLWGAKNRSRTAKSSSKPCSGEENRPQIDKCASFLKKQRSGALFNGFGRSGFGGQKMTPFFHFSKMSRFLPFPREKPKNTFFIPGAQRRIFLLGWFLSPQIPEKCTFSQISRKVPKFLC